MQLSDIFLQLGEENFNNLLRSISMGRLKTYQLYDRMKTILYLNKLNSETLRKATPRIWARVGEHDDEFASDVIPNAIPDFALRHDPYGARSPGNPA